MTETSSSPGVTGASPAPNEHSTVFENALWLAGRGLRVFPALAGMKRPAFAGWQAAATTDPDVIRSWFEGKYSNANVGIATGGTLLVIDADGAVGKASLEVIESVLGADLGLIVDTPSGGRHAYLTIPEGQWVPNGVKSLKDYPGIDIRADGGLVIAPGSTVKGKKYKIFRDGGMPLAPQWLIDTIVSGRKQRVKAGSEPLVSYDDEGATLRAIDWLVNEATDAKSGENGNDETYKIAGKVKDFGISEDQTAFLMDEHWNHAPRVDPPWEFDDLASIVANAFRYGTSRPGVKNPRAEFDAVEIAEPANDNVNRPLVAGRVCMADLLNLPPRQWLYGFKVQRKYVTFLVSPGGVGKSAWIFAAALAMASHTDLLGDRSRKPLRVWVYNLEDPFLELERRVSAAVQFHKLPPETLENFRLNSGRDRPFKIVKTARDGESFIVLPDYKLVIEEIKREGIDVLFVDPFLRSHSVSENENEAQDEVMRLYAQIAEETDCAVVLAHHTKKGAIAGEMDSMRGASAQGAGARSVYALSPMSAEEGAKLGIPSRLQRLYIKVLDAKNNMSPPVDEAEWFKLESFGLANGDDEYPDGDSLQVATNWAPPAALDGMSEVDAAEALATIGRGMPDGERYSVRPQEKDRWAGNVLVEQCMRTPAAAKAILTEWIDTKVLEEKKYRSAAQRKDRNGLFLATEEAQ